MKSNISPQIKVSKSKRSPYVLNGDKIYVEAKYSGISPLVIMMCSLPISTFGKGKTPYISLDEAIQWHEREIKETNGKHPDNGLKLLMTVKNKFLLEKAKLKLEES